MQIFTSYKFDQTTGVRNSTYSSFSQALLYPSDIFYRHTDRLIMDDSRLDLLISFFSFLGINPTWLSSMHLHEQRTIHYKTAVNRNRSTKRWARENVFVRLVIIVIQLTVYERIAKHRRIIWSILLKLYVNSIYYNRLSHP